MKETTKANKEYSENPIVGEISAPDYSRDEKYLKAVSDPDIKERRGLAQEKIKEIQKREGNSRKSGCCMCAL